MNFKKYLYSAALVTTLAMALTGCNTSDSAYSPQEIIDQAMQETVDATTYYGEYTMDMGDNQPTEMREWVKKGKRRIEMIDAIDGHFIIVNTGHQMTTFDVKNNSAMILEMGDEELSTNSSQSPREQAEMLLNLVQDTHTISVEGDEKIAGRDSYHIVAKAQKGNTLIGDTELWIDKKTWFILKTVSTSGDLTMTLEYTLLDLDADIDDTQFELELPTDATIEKIDDSSYAFETSTIDEVKETLGNFLQFREEDLQLLSVSNLNVEARPEFSLAYTQDSIPALTLSVLKNDRPATEIPSPEEKLTIRGLTGEKMDLGNFRLIQWAEDGILYGVIIENPDLTFDEVISFIEQMQLN